MARASAGVMGSFAVAGSSRALARAQPVELTDPWTTSQTRDPAVRTMAFDGVRFFNDVPSAFRAVNPGTNRCRD